MTTTPGAADPDADQTREESSPADSDDAVQIPSLGTDSDRSSAEEQPSPQTFSPEQKENTAEVNSSEAPDDNGGATAPSPTAPEGNAEDARSSNPFESIKLPDRSVQERKGSAGPVYELIELIQSDPEKGFAEVRRIMTLILVLGFVTAAGFVGVTWQSQRIGGGEVAGGGGLKGFFTWVIDIVRR